MVGGHGLKGQYKEFRLHSFGHACGHLIICYFALSSICLFDCNVGVCGRWINESID